MKIQIATVLLTGILSFMPATPALAADTVTTGVSASGPATVTILNSRDLKIEGASQSATVQLRFAGAELLEFGTTSGELVVNRHGSVQHYRPEAYQIINGKERHLAVTYTRSGVDLVTVNFGNFDNSAPIFVRGGAATR
jgi:hypothetical protein